MNNNSIKYITWMLISIQLTLLADQIPASESVFLTLAAGSITALVIATHLVDVSR